MVAKPVHPARVHSVTLHRTSDTLRGKLRKKLKTRHKSPSQEDESESSYPNSISSLAESDSNDAGGLEKSFVFFDEEHSSLWDDLWNEDSLDILEPNTLYGIPSRRKLLDSFDLAGIAKFIKQRPGCRIIVLTGAGISVAAGIPDFRTPGTGLYSRLEQYNLPIPSAIFDLDYFPSHPEPFYTLAKELWPGNYSPTLVHFFIKLLHEKGLLLRNYTQNIDGLELVAGLPRDALVEVHGTFATARCLSCTQAHSSAAVKDAVFADRLPRCQCGGLIKPDIVFFGEHLPERFFRMVDGDFDDAELVIIIGTSLQVAPFSSLPERCDDDVPRLLINNEVVGETGLCRPSGFDFSENNYRDAKVIGDCQEGILQLAELLGWKQELLEREQQAKQLHIMPRHLYASITHISH